MDKKASDILNSRGFWNNVIGAVVTMVVSIIFYLVRELGLPVTQDVITMVVAGSVAYFLANTVGYKVQDARRALNEAPKG